MKYTCVKFTSERRLILTVSEYECILRVSKQKAKRGRTAWRRQTLPSSFHSLCRTTPKIYSPPDVPVVQGNWCWCFLLIRGSHHGGYTSRLLVKICPRPRKKRQAPPLDCRKNANKACVPLYLTDARPPPLPPPKKRKKPRGPNPKRASPLKRRRHNSHKIMTCPRCAPQTP